MGERERLRLEAVEACGVMPFDFADRELAFEACGVMADLALAFEACGVMALDFADRELTFEACGVMVFDFADRELTFEACGVMADLALAFEACGVMALDLALVLDSCTSKDVLEVVLKLPLNARVSMAIDLADREERALKTEL